MGNKQNPSQPRDSDRPVVRMIVIETDEPPSETQQEHGIERFGQIVDRHFSRAGDAQDPPLRVETEMKYIITAEGGKMPKYSDFDDYGALLITGSMYSADGDEPWILELLDLLKRLWVNHPKMHFSGVCFGHQILCRMLGSEIASADPKNWELGHSKISLSPAGQRLFRTDKPEVYLHQMHQDYVVAPPTVESAAGLLPEGTKVEVWGHSEHTRVQGVYIKDKLFTTQAHLAFDEGMVKSQIRMRIESGGIVDREHADRAAETGDMDHDGDVAAEAILRFFDDDVDDEEEWKDNH